MFEVLCNVEYADEVLFCGYHIQGTALLQLRVKSSTKNLRKYSLKILALPNAELLIIYYF